MSWKSVLELGELSELITNTAFHPIHSVSAISFPALFSYPHDLCLSAVSVFPAVLAWLAMLKK